MCARKYSGGGAVMAMDNRQALGRKLKSIRGYLHTDFRHNESYLPRPFFVEVAGTPDSGKTMATDKIYDALRREGFRISCPQEGAAVLQDIPRTTPLYNIATGLYALNILIHESAAHNHDVVIFNRCIFDAYVWMEYWHAKNLLTSEEKIRYQHFFLSKFWVNKIDLAYLVVCDPEIAAARDLDHAYTTKIGESTDPKSIAVKIELHKKAFAKLAPKYPQLRFLDTTNLDRKSTVDNIANEIIDTFAKISRK